jgi:hypothetical protein
MCFGLSSAPRIFTKVTKPLRASLRDQGVRLSSYIDDHLVLHSAAEGCSSDVAKCMNLLHRAGFICNEKCSLTPSQRFVYLGVVIDTVAMKFFLTDEKRRRISSSLAAMLQQHAQTGRVSLQSLASLIGLLNFCCRVHCTIW